MRRLALLLAFTTGCNLFSAKTAEPQPRATMRGAVLGVAYAAKFADSVCAKTALSGALPKDKSQALASTCARAYRVARESLLAAEAALDSWQAGDESKAVCAAAKGARALIETTKALESAGVDLPNSISDGAALASVLVSLGESTCKA